MDFAKVSASARSFKLSITGSHLPLRVTCFAMSNVTPRCFATLMSCSTVKATPHFHAQHSKAMCDTLIRLTSENIADAQREIRQQIATRQRIVDRQNEHIIHRVHIDHLFIGIR